MRKAISHLTLFLFQLILFISCTKPAEQDPGNPPNPPTVPPIDTSLTTVNNTWQCVIDGKNYSGVIDSSFFQMVFGYESADSVIVSTGTSDDKKSHIHFKLTLNRNKFPATGVNNASNTFLVFDTAANKVLRTSEALAATVNYKIDTITGINLVVSFSGVLIDYKNQTHTISGKFSCKLFKGNNDPNKFYCLIDSTKKFGYFTSAELNANTLILEGLDYMDDSYFQFRILVRTGGTIKPGTYKSSNGDVAFNSLLAGAFGGYCYVDDSLGNMTVTIHSVVGNIVRGTFSGISENWRKIDTGSFVCRVANYRHEQDAENRWAFGAWIDHSFGLYNCYAGNISRAFKTSANGLNYLTINGESDNGASQFKIVLRSNSPITKGPYIIHSDNFNVLDTLYFKSGVRTWDGTLPYLYSHQGTALLGGETFCFIDTIDNTQVKARLYGIIWNNLQDVYFGPGYSSFRKISKGYVSATF